VSNENIIFDLNNKIKLKKKGEFLLKTKKIINNLLYS